jgi:hypothetical protein
LKAENPDGLSASLGASTAAATILCDQYATAGGAVVSVRKLQASCTPPQLRTETVYVLIRRLTKVPSLHAFRGMWP